MTTATGTNGTESAAVNAGLRRYAKALQGGRKSVRRVLGDVDPDYNFTDWLFRIAVNDVNCLKSVYGSERTKASLSASGGGASGGYLVPTELRTDLMQDVAEDAIMRPRATVVPMTSSMMELPLPDATTVQAAGTSPFFGGLLMLWTGEAATLTETEPAFRQVTLKAWELTGYALESNPHYDDSPGVDTWLRKLFARSIAWYEDYAYLRGTGAGQPLGIVNAPGAALVTRSGATDFTVTDAGTMLAKLLPGSWERAVWAVNPSVYLKLVAQAGWQSNQPDSLPRVSAFYQGLPMLVSSKLPALGTKGDVILFDPQLYVIGDRGAVEISLSQHEPTAYLKNQSVWRVIYRGDGQPWFSSQITLADATTAVSPYVVLV